jgi:hypothetical protein
MKKKRNGALAKEIIKANEIDGENVETIYFFGEERLAY